MTREQAIEIVKTQYPHDHVMKTALGLLIPELSESEDERIRRKMIEHFKSKTKETWCNMPVKDILAWLEKQKDHFRDDTKMVELQDYSGLNDLERAIHRGFLSAGVENAPVTLIKETAKECLEQVKPSEINIRALLSADRLASAEMTGRLKERSEILENPEEYGLHKPSEWSEEDKINLNSILNHLKEYLTDGAYTYYEKWLKALPERFNLQPKQEWSEEDDWKRKELIQYLKEKGDYRTVWMTWLESFCPPQDRCKDCPHRGDMFLLTQGVKSGKHDLAIKFMEYLDENRPEGKICLSNSECEDIDKAFSENDWNKIIRYIEKYRLHWKPSEEQMKALLNAEGYLLEGDQFDSAKSIAQLYEQLKRL